MTFNLVTFVVGWFVYLAVDVRGQRGTSKVYIRIHSMLALVLELSASHSCCQLFLFTSSPINAASFTSNSIVSLALSYCFPSCSMYLKRRWILLAESPAFSRTEVFLATPLKAGCLEDFSLRFMTAARGGVNECAFKGDNVCHFLDTHT